MYVVEISSQSNFDTITDGVKMEIGGGADAVFTIIEILQK